MNDPGLKNLLTWGIQHSDVSPKDASATPPRPMSEDDREALQSVIDGLRGQSDAERMKESMTVIENAEAQSEAKYTAFENFQMLLEVIDNANNMKPDDLWTRLIKQLESDDPKLRMYAAWCCGTAVQNNITSQERLLALDAIPTLVSMATEDIDRDTRKKAITAISSAVRNFQPGLDKAVSRMPTHYKPQERLDANDMNSVDILINKLRENV